MKIAVDAGHFITKYGGKETPDGVQEWTYNETAARGFEDRMSIYEGVETLRLDDVTGETEVTLAQRVAASNAFGADYLISFRHNVFLGEWGDDFGGTEAIVQTLGGEPARLARVLLNAALLSLGLNDRGVKDQDRLLSRESNAITVSLELGFLDSLNDIIIADADARYEVGAKVADALANDLGLKANSESYKKKLFPKGGNIKNEWDARESRLAALSLTLDTKMDDVMEIGFENGYNWIKYGNGYMEADGKQQFSGIKFTVQKGNFWRTPDVQLTIPVGFVGTPAITADFRVGNGGECYTGYAENGKIFGIRPGSYANLSEGWIVAKMTGRWK